MIKCTHTVAGHGVGFKNGAVRRVEGGHLLRGKLGLEVSSLVVLGELKRGHVDRDPGVLRRNQRLERARVLCTRGTKTGG